MYQALYRKWRPKTVDDGVGQRHITDTLKKQVESGRLSHAYLFIGTRGTGKTTCAKILAKAVNCEHPVNGNPCGKCPACRGIDDGSVLDVVEMDAASNNGVDNVRALRDEAVFTPAAVKKRVYIVDEVHMLSASAFNALLKILEEPPEHLMFILATTELQKVPATILSRCQRHSFKRLDMASIVGRLQFVAEAEGLPLTPDAAELIARLSEGGMRDALSLLDQCAGRDPIDAGVVYSAMGLAGRRDTAQLLRCIAARDTAGALALFQKLWQDGKDPASLLGELAALQRDVLMMIVAPRGGDELLSAGYDRETLDGFAKALSAGELISGVHLIEETLGNMRTGQARVLCELCLVRLCRPELGDRLPQLRERVAKLEAALQNGAALPVSAAAAPPPFPAPAKAMQQDGQDATFSAADALSPPEDTPPFDREKSPPPEDSLSFDHKDSPPPIDTPPRADASPEPVPPSAGPARDAPAVPGGWEEILSGLRQKLPVGIFAMLSDPVKTAANLSGGELTLYVEPGFAMNNISRPDVRTRIADAARELLGREVAVRVTETGRGGEAPGKDAPQSASPRADKLDELKKFGIVKFK